MPEPLVAVDLAAILHQLGDYQLQRDVKSRRHMTLVSELMAAINDLLNLAFENEALLSTISFIEPMNEVVKRMLDTVMEMVRTNNDDVINMLAAVRAIFAEVGKAVDDYDRRSGRPTP